jgi:anti-anti-sigma regulatory factor
MSQPLPLRYNLDRTFPIARVRLCGTLTSRSITAARTALLSGLSHHPVSLLIDLGQVVELDHAGAQMLLDLGRRNAQWPGAALLLFPVAPPTADLLRRAGVGRYAQFYASEEEAVSRAEAVPAPLRVEHELAAGVEAAALARSVVARTCHRWGVPHAISSAQVVASELVNSAVRDTGSALEFTISYRDDVLVLSVHDRDPSPPRRWAPPKDVDEASRGLLLLDAFAARWGTVPTAEGKTVWATVAT